MNEVTQGHWPNPDGVKVATACHSSQVEQHERREKPRETGQVLRQPWTCRPNLHLLTAFTTPCYFPRAKKHRPQTTAQSLTPFCIRLFIIYLSVIFLHVLGNAGGSAAVVGVGVKKSASVSASIDALRLSSQGLKDEKCCWLKKVRDAARNQSQCTNAVWSAYRTYPAKKRKTKKL